MVVTATSAVLKLLRLLAASQLFYAIARSGLPKKPSYVYEHAVIQQLVADPLGSARS